MAKAPVTKSAAHKAATRTRSASLPNGNAGEVETLPGIFVRSFSPTFRRAGFEFTQDGYGLLLKDLSEAQLEAIRSEPLLNVQDSEFPVTENEDRQPANQVSDDNTRASVNADATGDANASSNGGGQSEGNA